MSYRDNAKPPALALDDIRARIVEDITNFYVDNPGARLFRLSEGRYFIFDSDTGKVSLGIRSYMQSEADKVFELAIYVQGLEATQLLSFSEKVSSEMAVALERCKEAEERNAAAIKKLRAKYAR